LCKQLRRLDMPAFKGAYIPHIPYIPYVSMSQFLSGHSHRKDNTSVEAFLALASQSF
jgi:hypothetical protein